MATMKAAVVRGTNDLAWLDVPEPEPFGTRPVKVRIGAVGVCGSDVLRYAHGTAYHYPIVLGHEFSATVEEAPEDSTLRAGDKVAVFPLLPNEDDPLTGIGEWALGEGYDYFGSRRDGGMGELLWVPEANLVPVPADVPLVHAAVVEPAAVALHAVAKLTVPAAGVALVIGAGPIGALAAQWLRILGWARVIVADVDERKRDTMSELGFEVIDASDGDTVAAVMSATAGRGVDAAVEASGLPATFLQCLDACAAQGQLLVLGDLKGAVTISKTQISSLIRRELTVVGTWNSKITPAGRSEWDMVVRHIAAGTLAVDALISQVADLADASTVLDDVAQRRVWSNKVVFAVSKRARTEWEAHTSQAGALAKQTATVSA